MLRVFLTAVAGVLYAAGWLAGKVWLALAWLGRAVLVGWRDAIQREQRLGVPEKVRAPAWPAPPPREAA